MKKYLLSVLVLVLSVCAVHAQPAGWLYEEPFAVTNSSPQLITNYTIQFTVNTQALISAGKMQADGSDIRFGTPCTGIKSLQYYIFSGINTTTTSIDVTIDSLPANSTRTIYMFYGNDTITTTETLAVLDGPHTMFNNQNLNFTLGGVPATTSPYAANTTCCTADSIQAGVHFQPTQPILVTSLGSYVPTPYPGTPPAIPPAVTPSYFTSDLGLQLWQYDAMSVGTILSDTGINNPTSGNYSFTNIRKPVLLSSGGGNTYAVSLAVGNNNQNGYYSFSNGLAPSSPEVTILGGVQGSPTAPHFADSTAPTITFDMQGYADIKYYIERQQNSYVSYQIDTVVNGSAFIDPVSKEICPGNATSFSAVAGGATTTYQWQVNDGNSWVNVSASTLYSGVNLSELDISAVTTAMNGYQYRAYMTSTCGTGYSAPATLTVNTNPFITPVGNITGPTPVCLNTNATYTLTSNVPQGTYAWYVNGVVQPGYTGTQFGFSATGRDTVNAVITNPTNAAFGCYIVPDESSNLIVVLTSNNITPADSIAASSNGSCQGGIVDFRTYTNVIGGSYQWYVNNIAVAQPLGQASTFSYVPNNGDRVTETITTPQTSCYSVNAVTSAPVVANTVPGITPNIVLSAPATAAVGDQFTVTANVTNYGTGYKIYWYDGSYHLLDSTTNGITRVFTKTAQTFDYVVAKIKPQTPQNGTCYEESAFSNLLKVGITPYRTSVNNVAGNNGISTYPNPFGSKIVVNGLQAGDKLMMYDMAGRATGSPYESTGTTGEYMFENLASGHYILRVTDSEGNSKANLPVSKL